MKAQPSAPPNAAELQVSASDIDRIDVLQSLLSTLNDPRASAGQLARHVQQSRVLSARIGARFRQRHASRDLPKLPEQIAILGNREIETILLGLLEDIITLASERTG